MRWALAPLLAAACQPRSTPAPGDATSTTTAPATSTTPATPTPTPTPTCAPSAEARTAEARALYGDTIRTAVVDATFLFFDPDHGPLFDTATRFAPRVLDALRNDRIGAAQSLCPVSVYLFASRDRFRAHCALRHDVPDTGADWGIYDRARREIVVDLSGGPDHVPSLAHELAHVLMDADFQAAPRWFRECVASLYEAPLLPRPGEIHGAPDWRYPQLRAALAAHDPDAHLGALFAMTDPVFRADDPSRYLLHYATARAACQWLDDHSQLWPFYRQWRDHYPQDHDGTAAFTLTTGHAPPDADPAWRLWSSRK